MANKTQKKLRWQKPKLESLNAIKQANGDCTRGSGHSGNCITGEVPSLACSTGSGDT